MIKIKELFINKIQFWKQTKYQRLLGYKEHNSKIYDIAFMHSSMSYRDKKGQLINNERLEYLGDAVLETAMSDILFNRYPEKKEGFLSATRATLVCRKTTNEIGKKIGLDKYITTRKTVNNFNVYGNMFEALIGAIYIDQGYYKAKHFIKQTYDHHIKYSKLLQKEKNYKSLLLEWCQKNKVPYSYELIEEKRLGENKIQFQSKVIIDGKNMGQGIGYSKKESEQAAAKQAVHTLR